MFLQALNLQVSRKFNIVSNVNISWLSFELKSCPSAEPSFRSTFGEKNSEWSLMGTYVMVGAHEIKEAARRN